MSKKPGFIDQLNSLPREELREKLRPISEDLGRRAKDLGLIGAMTSLAGGSFKEPERPFKIQYEFTGGSDASPKKKTKRKAARKARRKNRK